MASLFCKSAARALRVASATPKVAAPVHQTLPKLPAQFTQTRGMGGGGGHGGGVTFKGVTVHPPDPTHVYLSEFFGAMMWFWIFYRAKEDGHTFIYGHAEHFEHEAHDEHH